MRIEKAKIRLPNNIKELTDLLVQNSTNHTIFSEYGLSRETIQYLLARAPLYDFDLIESIRSIAKTKKIIMATTTTGVAFVPVVVVVLDWLGAPKIKLFQSIIIYFYFFSTFSLNIYIFIYKYI